MDTLLVLISLSFHYTYAAASQDERRRFAKRQQVSPSSSSSSSEPTQTPTSMTTQQSSEPPLPASIQSRIPIPSGVIQTTIPQHPDPKPDKGLIIGFSVGVVVLVFLFIAAGWLLLQRYKKRRQRQAALQNLVQLQATNPSRITIKTLDDTQPAASQK